jgi:hypothetical protein
MVCVAGFYLFGMMKNHFVEEKEFYFKATY